MYLKVLFTTPRAGKSYFGGCIVRLHGADCLSRLCDLVRSLPKGTTISCAEHRANIAPWPAMWVDQWDYVVKGTKKEVTR